MPKFRARNVLECAAKVPKYDAAQAQELDLDLKRRQTGLLNERESPRTLDAWVAPPYECLCPLGFHEVDDVRKWKDIRASHKLYEGLYVCQPLVGYYKESSRLFMPGWVLVSRILLGYRAGSYLVRTFWLTDATIGRTEADFHRLGLPMSVADKAVEFDRGGVLAMVDEQTNPDDPLPYRVVSLTGLQGIGYLHAEFLDYERARREQAATEVETGLSPSAGLGAAVPTRSC
jgi:hypothetical protein